MTNPPSGPALDRNVALARAGGDPELLREIATLFLENYQVWLQEMHAAAARGDAKALADTAHGLKGSVANFGAATAVNAALEVENLGRSRNLANVAQSLAALEKALAALRPELASL